MKNKIEDKYDEYILNSEINLHDDTQNGEKNGNFPHNKKYRINFNNIGRKEYKLENSDSSQILERQENSEMTQIIVISKKRKRDHTDDLLILDIDLDNPSHKKVRTCFDEIPSILSQTFKNLALSDLKIIPEKTPPGNQNNQNSLANFGNTEFTPKEIEIKDRSSKIFPIHDKCKICTPISNENSNIFKSFYPSANVQSSNNEYLKNIKNHENQQNIKQFSDCRQLKFLEKRKILTNLINSSAKTNTALTKSLFTSNDQFREIKNYYTKLYGECKIIDENEKLIIINKKPMSSEEIKKSIIGNKEDLSFFTMEVERKKCQSDLDIVAEVKNYEENNFVAKESSDSEEKLNQMDYDSNYENNSNNEYPDEEDSQEEEEEDEYKIYKTNAQREKGNYDYIKTAEKKLNNAYIKCNERLLYGNYDSGSDNDYY